MFGSSRERGVGGGRAVATSRRTNTNTTTKYQNKNHVIHKYDTIDDILIKLITVVIVTNTAQSARRRATERYAAPHSKRRGKRSYIYIYIEREMYTHTYMCIYIYTYIERDTDR